MKDSRRRRYIAMMVVFLLLASCSVQNDYSTLSFFFDGVPNPELIRQAAIADSLEAALATTDSSTLLTGNSGQEYFIHQPYLEKQCADCHNQGRMGSLNQNMPDLCYQCHIDFGMKYSFQHGPSTGGYCTQCHDPHKAKKENLLRHAGRELCLHCHETAQMNLSPFHDSSDETSCIICHNPHGSNNHSLLQPGVCTQCHEDFREEYKVVHGPVAGGNCSTCHVPHRKGTEKLLVRTGRYLCLYCHDSDQIMAIENHVGTEEMSCTECHNPHGGDNRFMFNK